MSQRKEEVWRRHKYEVLSHSECTYRTIQRSIQRWTVEEVDAAIQEAKTIEPTAGSVTNAYEHMWGYVKKKATQREKERTFELLASYREGTVTVEALWQWMRELAHRYDIGYLKESTILCSVRKRGCPISSHNKIDGDK